MSFLPIVQRELRVAARRRSTYRVRWWTALLAMLVSFLALLVAGATGGGPTVGGHLFNLLTGYAFALCLLAGVLLTADALSEEKREGTLGLLFLTDLKGYDVVLGKFLAMSLNAFYGLLALLPIAAFPLLMGGVSGAEFSRVAVALVNALFFSLALGIGVSAWMRDSQKAVGNTLGLMLLVAGVLPGLAELGAQAQLSPVWLGVAQVSPFYPFYYAKDMLYAGNSGRFWGALVASHLLGWVFLMLASWVLPRSWQERAKRPKPAWREIRSGGLVRPKRTLHWSKSRAELLTRNPVLWLVRGARPFPWAAWLVVLAWGVLVGCVISFMPSGSGLPELTEMGIMPFCFLLKVLFTFEACRFFAEARRNGSLELLLCTPLTNRDILRAHALGLWLSFRWPLLVFLALVAAPAGAQFLSAFQAGDLGRLLTRINLPIFSAIHCARLTLDLFALCWFGTWLSLSMKKPNLAAAATVFFVLVLPSVLSMCLMDMVADVFFISYGVMRLQQDLRWLLAQQHQLATPLAGPLRPMSIPTAMPPVIPG